MAIFITVLLWFGILSPQQPATGKGKEALKKYEAQQNEQTQDCAPVTVQCCPQAQNSKAKSDDSDAESKSWTYRAYLISGPFVVVVTIGTLILVWRQIRAMKQIERAWLVVTTEPPHTMVKAKGRSWFENGFGFDWYIRNCGKTPAFITRIGARLHRVEALIDLHKEPLIEKFESFPHGMSIGPTETIPWYTFASPEDKQPITSEEWKDFNEGKFCWVGYGIVQYKLSIDSKIRETRFCYLWTPQGPNAFVRSALPERYTKQT
jgi:hypothetical protein